MATMKFGSVSKDKSKNVVKKPTFMVEEVVEVIKKPTYYIETQTQVEDVIKKHVESAKSEVLADNKKVKLFLLGLLLLEIAKLLI